jgi:hypothetical protein
MSPINPQSPSIVPMPANDLPSAPSAQHARLRSRERRLRGPTWAEPMANTQVA